MNINKVRPLFSVAPIHFTGRNRSARMHFDEGMKKSGRLNLIHPQFT
jgi:hypothetical protein